MENNTRTNEMARRGHNEGTIRRRADGRWEAMITLPTGQRKSLYGKTRAEAAQKLNRAQADAAEGKAWGNQRQTVEQYMRWWLEEQAKPSVRLTTYEAYRTYTERHIIPGLGSLRLLQMSPQHVQAFLNGRLKLGLKPRTVVQIRAILRRALGQGVKMGLLNRNVAQYASPPKVERYEICPLTPEQARTFVEGIRGDRLEALYTLTLAVGLRLGEALGLLWDDVDLETGTLTVRGNLQRLNRESQRVPVKTDAGRRTVALPRFVVESLLAHCQRQLDERARFDDVYTYHGYVFSRPDGRPLEGTRITHQLQETLEKLGLPRQRFHDLRHGAASLMKAQGVDLKSISATLGHSQIAITADLYTHLFPEGRRDIADRMDALFEGAP
jgi:integrase